jgi:hypothetical protein
MTIKGKKVWLAQIIFHVFAVTGIKGPFNGGQILCACVRKCAGCRYNMLVQRGEL